MGRESRIRQMLRRRRETAAGEQRLENGQTADGFLHQIQAGLRQASTPDDVVRLAGDVLRQPPPPELRLRDDAGAEAATRAILEAPPAEQRACFDDVLHYLAYRASTEGVIRFLEGAARVQR